MERLIKPKTFQNGVTVEIKTQPGQEPGQVEVYLCMSGGPLAPILQALQMTSLDLRSDSDDCIALANLLGLVPQVLRRTA